MCKGSGEWAWQWRGLEGSHEAGRWRPERGAVKQEPGEPAGARTRGPCGLGQEALTFSQERYRATEGMIFQKDPSGAARKLEGRAQSRAGKKPLWPSRRWAMVAWPVEGL